MFLERKRGGGGITHSFRCLVQLRPPSVGFSTSPRPRFVCLCLPVSRWRNGLVDMAEISCSKAWRLQTVELPTFNGADSELLTADLASSFLRPAFTLHPQTDLVE